MKLVFLGSSGTIIYYMRFHRVVRTTYDREQDTFRAWFLIGPCLLLALLINGEFTPIEVCRIATVFDICQPLMQIDNCAVLQILWTFSLYLEAVAILPQLVLLQRTQNIDNLTGNYILLLG